MEPRERLEKLRRLKELRQKAGASAPAQSPEPIPDQPAGMTYAGMPGRMQMDVGMGKTPTQVGGSLLLEATNGFMEWAGNELSDVTPQLVKDWFKYEFGSAVNALPKDFVKAASSGIDSIKQWVANNPEKARAANAALMAGSTMAPVLRAGMKTGSYDKAVTNTLKPYMNEHNKAEMLNDGRLKPGYIGGGRSAVDEQGWGRGLSKTAFVVTDEVKQQARALKTVPGFNPYQTNIRRFELVDKEIANASNILQSQLDDLGKTGAGLVSRDMRNKAFSKSNVRSVFNKQRGVTRNTYLTDAEYQRIAEDIRHYIHVNRADGAVSVGHIHKQRKLIDHAFRNAKGQRRAAGDLLPSRDELIWKTERDILNKIIDRTSTKAGSERARIATLYDVRETLHQKATKGHIKAYDDFAEHVPLIGDTAVRIVPGVR